jgi:predicted Holliday junction resolvase-like endonuclease
MLQGFRRVCVICPCCDSVFRLSETTPYFRSPPPRTPWDDLDGIQFKVERAVTRLEKDRAVLRQRALDDGRQEMRRRLRKIAAFYRRQRIELEDLKLLFDPVDYVAFRGMSSRRCTSVQFIDCEATSRRQERLQLSLESALKAGNVSWVTMRVADNGHVTCARS